MAQRAATGGEKGGALANWDKGKGEGAVPAADGDKATSGEKGQRAGGSGLPMTAPWPCGASPTATATATAATAACSTVLPLEGGGGDEGGEQAGDEGTVVGGGFVVHHVVALVNEAVVLVQTADERVGGDVWVRLGRLQPLVAVAPVSTSSGIDVPRWCTRSGYRSPYPTR